MAENIFQQPKVYLVIGDNEELVEKIKTKLAEKPLVEVYVLRPAFFAHPEFAQNPIWEKNVERIFYVVVGQEGRKWSDQNHEIRLVGQKIARFQEKISVLFLNYSPPPLQTSAQAEEIVRRWREQSWWEDDWRTKLALEMPKATIVVGQDVLLSGGTKEVPIDQIKQLVRFGEIPTWGKGEDYYWQMSEDFFEVVWEKLVTPFKGRRLVVLGKKVTATAFKGLLNEISEKVNGFEMKTATEEVSRKRRQILKTELGNWERIVVKNTDDEKLKAKWHRLIELGLKRKTEKPTDRVKKKSEAKLSSSGENLFQVNKKTLFEKGEMMTVLSWENWAGQKMVVTERTEKTQVVIPEEQKVKRQKVAVQVTVSREEERKVVVKTREVIEKEKSRPKKEKSEKEVQSSLEQDKVLEKTRDEKKSATPEQLEDKIEQVLVLEKEPLLSPREKKKKRVRRRMGVFLSVLGVSVVLIVGLVWWQAKQKENRYYRQLQLVLADCWQDADACDWQLEAKKVSLLEQELVEQRRVYQMFTAETASETELSVWRELIGQLTVWQENNEELKTAIEDVYLGLVGRSETQWQAVEKWRILTDLNWQNEQIGLKVRSLLNQAEGQSWQGDNFIEEVKEILSEQQQKNQEIITETNFWQEVWGQKGERFYGVVLFNPAELRPAGGVVEAVVILQVVNGEIKALLPYSVAEIEKQISAKPQAQGFEAEFLEMKSGSLREIGGDFDFELTGSKIKWYLDRVTNKKIDGLIAINLDLVEREIKNGKKISVGGELWDGSVYQLKTEADGLKKTSNDEKSVFYKNLLLAWLQEKMLWARGEVLLELKKLGAVKEMKEVSWWMAETELENKVKQAGWSGSELELDCQQVFKTTNCVTDSLIMSVSTMPGSEREDLQVKREERVEIGQNEVKHYAKFVLSGNAGKSFVISLYWPQKATQRLMSLNGKSGGGEWQNGALVSFNQKEKTMILEVSYVLEREGEGKAVGNGESGGSGSEESREDDFYYTYWLDKRPGLNGVEREVTVINRGGENLKLVAPKAELKGDSLVFRDNGEKESLITIQM